MAYSCPIKRKHANGPKCKTLPLNASTKRKHKTLPLMGATRLASGIKAKGYSSFGFGRERPERPKAPSPGQAKRHPGYRVLKQSRPVRAKALRHGAGIEQNIHTLFYFKTAKSAIKQE